MKLDRRSRALLISLALHAALLIAMLRLAPRPREAPSEVEVEIRYVQPPPPPAPPSAPKPPAIDLGTPRPTPAKPPSRQPPSAQAVRPSAPSGGGDGSGKSEPSRGNLEAQAPAAPGQSDASGVPSDLPRALTLSPSGAVSDWAARSGPGDRGTLLRNEPGGYPDPEALKAQEGYEVQQKVQGWAQEDGAAARVELGNVDGYFHDLGGAMEKEAEKGVNQMLSGNMFKDLARAWIAGAESYGKSGNPYAAGEQPEKNIALDEDTPLARNAQAMPSQGKQNQSPAWNMKLTMDMQRMARDFFDGKFTDGLVAIVELSQDKLGTLLEARLVQGSGNPAYDTFVLGVAPGALSLLPPPPEKGAGIHESGLKSEWAFTGKIVYWRKLKDVDPATRALLIGAGAFTGMMRGDIENPDSFEVADPTHPQFKCKARLLKLY